MTPPPTSAAGAPISPEGVVESPVARPGFFWCPQWQAWVEAGRTREERNRRLAEAPEEFRSRIVSHVRTAFALRRWAQDRLYKKEQEAL